MEESIVFVGAMAPPLELDIPAKVVDRTALAAMLADAAAPEPAVVVLGSDLAQPLALARSVHARWQMCELVFVSSAAGHEALRGLVGRAPMIGSNWSAVLEDDPALGAVLEHGMRNAVRRARLRTTLDRANVRLAAPRQVEESQYRRLALAAHYLSNFLSQTPDGIVGLDPSLQVIQWNESAARQWNLPVRRALAMNAAALPFWSDRLAQCVRAALDGAGAATIELSYQAASGTVHMEFGVSGVRDDAGRTVGVSLVIRDITERRSLHEKELAIAAGIAAQIEARRRKLFDMFELAPGFIAVTRGPDHVLDMANRAYVALFGEGAHARVSLAQAFRETSTQPFIAIRDQVYASGIPYVGKAQQVTVRDKDGLERERYIDFVYQPWRDEQGNVAGIFCQGHDVTEHKQMQDGLLTHQAELEDLVARRTEDLRSTTLALQQSQKLEAIGKLTGGVAHDFNNILQVIASNLDLMNLERGLAPSLRQRISNSTAAVERAARLSAQLLAFARRQPLQPVSTNLGNVVKGMDELLVRALGGAVDVEVNTPAAGWNALVDRHQLENVILNIAINARDAMQAAGKLTIELANVELDEAYAAAHADLRAGQYVLLAVSDTGTGMSQDVLQHVFEPFYTTKPEGEGTGLGLSMAYGFVKQSGGHITIYSEPGEGTTVRIYLPRCLDAEHKMDKPTAGSAPGGTETILVVEDDAAVRIAVVDMLKGLGYAVLNAYDAESALAMLEAGIAPDLMFTDVVMPGKLRSPELARHARRLVPGIAILFTSGYTQNAIVHAGRLDEGVELLSKPYRRADLALRVRALLDAREVRAPKTQRVIVVEDNDDARDMLNELLLALGYGARCFSCANGVLDALEASDILLTDVTLPGQSGLELARTAREKFPGLRVIFATGRSLAADALPGKILLKPFSLEQLEAVLR